MCPPMRAHWRHLANTIELVLPWTNPSPQPKRHLNQFSRFCTVYLSVIRDAGACPSPSKLPLLMGDLNPHLIRGSLSPPDSASQAASQSVQPFSFCTAHSRMSLYFTVHTVDTPSTKLPLQMQRSGSPPNTWFLGRTKSSTQTASRSVHPFLQGSLLWQTDRQTDHATRSVTIGSICILWCGLKISMDPEKIQPDNSPSLAVCWSV